jgi:poly-beta-1,6-N-acetyl-D-glucosamine synthase
MLLQILFWLFVVISTINIIHFGLFLVGANCYDILKFKDAHKEPKKLKRQAQPKVTILVPAHNEELSIVRCLESLRKSSYRKFAVIVIDDASTDNTRKLVRQYIAEHPKRNVRLMHKNKNVGKANALNHALRNGADGDLIMTLDADSLIGKQSIANAVRYFDDPRVVGVAANVRVTAKVRVHGWLPLQEVLLGYE